MRSHSVKPVSTLYDYRAANYAQRIVPLFNGITGPPKNL